MTKPDKDKKCRHHMGFGDAAAYAYRRARAAAEAARKDQR